MKNELNKFIEKYKDFNDKIIEAKKFGISINENGKNKLSEINELLKNEIKNFYDSQNINEGNNNSNKDIFFLHLGRSSKVSPHKGKLML